MSIDQLNGDLFYFMVFGPGVGESIVLRVPPSTWIVVDGCRIGGTTPAASLLDVPGTEWSCVVLTHPHLDHASGLDDILGMPGKGPVGCVSIEVPDSKEWSDSPDPERVLRHAALEQVMAAIHDTWKREPSSRWEMRKGDTKTIGDARLEVLHPEQGMVDSEPEDKNVLSAPLLVNWEKVRLVLGADLPKAQWEDVGKNCRDLDDHAGLKIPHHGSRGAVSEVYAGNRGIEGRFWVLAPFSRNRLPRFEEDDGLAWILQHEDRVHLTGLPVSQDLQQTVPCEASLSDLRSGRPPMAAGLNLPNGLVLYPVANQASHPELSCYVIAGFSKDGKLAEVRYGPGSVVVTA